MHKAPDPREEHTSPPSSSYNTSAFIPKEQEIELLDVWRRLVVHKYIILGFMLGAILISATYLVSTTSIYRVEVRFLPPLEQNIQGLIVGEPNTEKYTPERIYAEFIKNIKSYKLRRKFFNENDLISHYHAQQTDLFSDKKENPDITFNKEFNEKLVIGLDETDERFVTLSLELDDPKLGAEWMNKFSILANQQTINDLYEDVISGIQSSIQRLNSEIESKVVLAQQRRNDRILKLQEALLIAESLDIKDSSAVPTILNSKSPEIAVNTSRMPLYMRGTKALLAEIKTLENRKNDAPFVKGLRNLEEQRSFLESSLSISKDNLRAATIDQPAFAPNNPVKPQKALVLALGLISGTLLGIFIAFFIDFLSKAKTKSQQFPVSL